MKQHIPNAITCLNLLSGCIGATFAFDGQLIYAGYAILIAAFFDFFDGMAARLLKVSSPVGKELDSLADMVSFGFLPAVILYQMFSSASSLGFGDSWIKYSSFLIAIFSALRLAKFNLDERQSSVFIGLPTPSCALFVLSLPHIALSKDPVISEYIQHPVILLILTMALSFLLVAEIPLMSLKFKNFRFQNNLYRYILIVGSLLLVFLFKLTAIPLVIVLYVALSLAQYNRLMQEIS